MTAQYEYPKETSEPEARPEGQKNKAREPGGPESQEGRRARRAGEPESREKSQA
jgi:hypothetical protein